MATLQFHHLSLNSGDRANREVKMVSTEPIDIEVIGGATVTQQSKIAEARPFKFKKGVESTPKRW